MVAKITFPRRVEDVLNYHEKKVQQGVAVCIGAAGYLYEPGEMNFYQKLRGLQSRNALNERAITRTLHVSLNFHPSEVLTDETLRAIAAHYLEGIGLARQPCLVYRHLDAGHPHLHVVSTLIREDGSRIPTHNLGRNQSEVTRKKLEVLFGLVPAEAMRRTARQQLSGIAPARAVYGKGETKSSIATVVRAVVNQYLFTSLPELNAALRPFHVVADSGKEGGRIARHQGLVYHILDERGCRIGVPIKASLLPGRPTLSNLQKRFVENAQKREAHKKTILAKIERCFSQCPSSLKALMAALGQQGVFTLPRRSAEGNLYGITFVDHETGCVVNGSDLGRNYSAAALCRRLGSGWEVDPGLASGVEATSHTLDVLVRQKAARPLAPKPTWANEIPFTVVSTPHSPPDPVPPMLGKKKKRKKKNTTVHQP
jgi:hypothetical protein